MQLLHSRFKTPSTTASQAKFLNPLSFSKQDTYELSAIKGHFVSFQQKESYVAKMREKNSAEKKKDYTVSQIYNSHCDTDSQRLI